MSANNKEPETISLCDMVVDLVHDELEINEDQNNVDLSLDDSNQPFACNRHSKPYLNVEGFRRQCNEDNGRIGPERAKTRVGCKAIIGLNKVDDTWIVCKFVEGHNHELLTPKSTSSLHGHRMITSAQKNLIDTLNESGIAPSKIMSVLSKEYGGDYNVGCIPVDI
ncbi:hypothetical protein SO802_012989 [Lithocarpus litseifolius]|uniref:FAR1 domain-containing protein n=1 Tax=Lithocarpus litseifolius TaxID=425828 RepID=A0AAW2D6W3_9ROSI